MFQTAAGAMDYWFWLERASEMAPIIALVLGVPSFYLQLKRLRRIEKQNSEGADAIEKLANIRRVSDGTDESIWSRQLVLGPFDYHKALDSSIPIILVGNLKGGVGKTTIAANLAAYFADQGERVLAIDMDYQGTMSALMVGHARISDAQILDTEHRKAFELLAGTRNADWLRSAREVNHETLSKLHFIASNYELADLENRYLIKWLLGDAEEDVRLNLARVLLDTTIQTYFDRVIIDTAPRMTLGFVAAACASTHLLIPTLLNEGSSRSVLDTLRQYEFLRRRICSHLQLLGIVGSMTYRGVDQNWTTTEIGALDNLKRDVYSIFKRHDLVLEDAKIRESPKIRDAAGYRLAYFDNDEARTMFQALGAEVLARAPGRRR